MQKLTQRRGRSLTFAAGDRSELELPNVDRWHRIWLRFTGTLAVTLGGGTAVLTQEAPYSAIRQIRLTLSGYRGLGNTTLFSLSGYQTAVFARVENPNYEDNFVAAAADGNNAWSFNLMVPVTVGETDFTGMIKLAGDKSASFVLSIDWGQTADFVTLAGAATATLTGSVTVNTETFQFLKGEAEKMGVRQDLIHQISSKRQVIDATGDGNIVDLTTGELYLRLIFLIRNNGLHVNGVFDIFELVVEDSVRPYTITEDQWRGQTRYRNLRDYPVGVYAIDRYWTRTWRDVYDALGLTQLQAVFNVTAAPVSPADITTIREVAIPTPAAAREQAA